MIPPLFAKISIQDKSNLRLWIPLFLLWILLAPLVILILPFVFVYLLIRKGPRGIKGIFLFYQLLCSLRGLDVDVKSNTSTVRIYVI